ncbi:hypothetical protein [Shimia sp. MIT910701]|uniref:hypothetical protein n=1 Tax=Shimia sp. MIT910701 TaxID=3096987 RepID=UPI003999B38A
MTKFDGCVNFGLVFVGEVNVNSNELQKAWAYHDAADQLLNGRIQSFLIAQAFLVVGYAQILTAAAFSRAVGSQGLFGGGFIAGDVPDTCYEIVIFAVVARNPRTEERLPFA